MYNVSLVFAPTISNLFLKYFCARRSRRRKTRSCGVQQHNNITTRWTLHNIVEWGAVDPMSFARCLLPSPRASGNPRILGRRCLRFHDVWYVFHGRYVYIPVVRVRLIITAKYVPVDRYIREKNGLLMTRTRTYIPPVHYPPLPAARFVASFTFSHWAKSQRLEYFKI